MTHLSTKGPSPTSRLRPRRTAVPLVAGFAVLAFAAAACSSSAQGPATGGASGGAAQGKPLTIGMPNGTQTNNSNPFLSSSSAMSLGYARQIYEPLVQVNMISPSSKPTPWLASAYEWNTDYTAVTFTARDNVKWSDGQPMTADDIAYSLQLRKDNKALNTEALPYKDIKAEGNKVTVSFSEGQFTHQDKVLRIFVVPKHIWSALSDPAKDLNQKPVGTGPYTLDRWSAQLVSLKPNASYWGGTPPVPELRYTSYADNTALTTALATGEAQWGWTFIADYKKVYIDKDPDNNKFWAPTGLGIDALFVNTTKAPFNDVAVRKAVNMVIDRDAIHSTAEAGLFPRLNSPTGIPEPAGSTFISAKYAGQKMQVDVEGAKKVLADAGYLLSGDQLMGKDGKQVAFTLNDPGSWNDYQASLQIIADGVKKLGMKATIVPDADYDPYNQKLTTGDFDAALHWTDDGLTPWNLYMSLMDGSQYKPIGQTANWNFGRFQNEEATTALSDYSSATDDATRKAALDKVQDIFVTQVPAIPSIGRPSAAEYTTKNYTGWPSDADPYAGPQPTDPNASMVVMKLKPKG